MADSGSIPFMWRHRRPLPLIMQTEAAECALACMSMVASYHGHDTDLPSLRRRFSTSLKGTSLSDLISIAKTLGFEARPLRAELEYLPEAQMPCILHWDMNHFVVLHQVTRKGLIIHDPARGRCSMPLVEVNRHFTGVLLELKPAANFSPIVERQRVSLRALTGRISGLGRTFVQIFALALAIEVLGLILPFQLQWVVDQVLLSSDKNLLLTITLGFLFVIIIQSGLALARGWVLSWLGGTLNSQWTTNLFSHLLKLPLDYFNKRSMGDVISRFNSVHAVQNTLTGSFVEAALDGLMGSLTIVLLCLYSIPLTFWIVATTGVYVALRWALFQRLYLINEEQLIYGAKQQTELMESIRGVQAIKLANKQSERRIRLANATIESARRVINAQRINLTFGAVNRGLFGIQRIVVITLGAYLAIAGKFSAGMLIAFVAYGDQFSSKIGGFVDKIVEFRMLRLHAERIADIALSEPEPHANVAYSGSEPAASLIVKNLSFRYADSEPWVIRGLNLNIKEGESVAIVGPSGCGKSTLAKLLLGLLTPQEGEISVGGLNSLMFGLERYRSMFAAVMQDDHLFSGSIADNIAFFDPQASPTEIQAAARAAAIHQDITTMPMGYETMVGDMGSALSGGQKQRLLLARAFYQKPKILVLDEATSHLDTNNESIANQAVRSMRITRIIIAHRQETIAQADRVFDLSDQVSELGESKYAT